MRGDVLCFLLLLGTSWPTSADEPKPLTAILVSARAGVQDPSFSDSLVLVMNNLGPAPVGVIVNRPTRIPVSRVFPDLENLAALHDKVYFGGPVDLKSVWFLMRATKPQPHAIQALPGVYIGADRELLRKLLRRDKPMDGLRVFIGHAGWGPGQLEAEISRGDWTLEKAEPDAIFDGKSEHPWPSTTPREPGT